MSEKLNPVKTGTDTGPTAAPCDRLVIALARLSQEFGGVEPERLLHGLPREEDGTLPFDQVENAATLIGLRAYILPHKGLPRKSHEYPVLARLDDGELAIIYDRDRSSFLYWTTAMEDAVWGDADELSARIDGTPVHVSANPVRLRGIGRKWAKTVEDSWFWSELAGMKRDFRPVLGAALLINLLAFALPLFTMNVYDRIIPNRAAASLWVLAIGVLLAFAIEFSLKIARANLLDELGRKLDLKLSEKIFSKLVNLPLSERSGDTGKLARRVSEFETVRDFFASTTILLVVDICFLILFVVMIAILAGFLALIPLAIIATMVFTGFALQRRMTAATMAAQIDAGLQHSLLVETIGGAETVKACTAEGRMIGRWRNLARMSAQTQERLRHLSAIAVNMAGLCQQITSISLVIGGFYLFDAGKITMGAIIAIIMLAGRSLAPAGQVAFVITRGRQALTILKSLDQMMDIEDERGFGSQSIIPTIRKGIIHFDDVSFAYPGSNRAALSAINLKIQPGEKIAIIGRVASGKSTLGRLICGLYYPREGLVTVDGVDNRQYRPNELRSELRFVGQDSELFSGSIKDNLLLGAPGADDATLIDALSRVGADSFLGGEDGGFDRGTGERGRNLSGGQRGFLVLARALASPSKLLFLDEPTGAMDMRTEKAFVDHLSSALAKGQTLIVSTHRHAILSVCDRIIVMDGGRIIADGPRDKIMNQALEKGQAA